MNIHQIRLVIACAIAALALTGCGGSDDRGSGSRALTWGVASTDPKNLDPFRYSDQGGFVFTMVYSTLTQPGPGGAVAPALATSWRQTTPTTWTFRLRRDVRFSNGRPMVADDVVTSFRRYMSAGAYSFLFLPARKATAQGKYTVRFETSEPDLAFPSRVQFLYVLPGRELRDGRFDPESETLGTGPYVVKRHAPEVSWTFTANPYYWEKGLPYVDTVNARIIKDEEALETALRSGEIDFAQPTKVDAARVLTGGDVKVQTVRTPDFYYIAMNALIPTEDAFKDQRVRQAVNFAIDRKQIIETALAGGAQVTGIPTSTYADGCDASALPGAQRDLDQARALLQAAGVSRLQTKLYISPETGAVAAPQIAQVIKANLADIGIDAEIVTVDLASWVERVFNKSDFSMTVNWWNGLGDASVRPNSWNPNVTAFVKGFVASDPVLNRLLSEANQLPRGDARTAVFNQICQRVANDANIIPLVTKPMTVAYRADRVAPVFPELEPLGFPLRYMYKFKLVGTGT